MPEPRQRYYNNDGSLAAGCYLYTYAAGTSTPKATYTDSAGATPQANPIVLDAKGEALIYWDGSYKVDLKTAAGVQITGYPVDNFVSYDTLVDTGDALIRSDLAASSGSSLVGTIAAGAGAVAATVQGALRRWVHVNAYGTNTTPGTTDMTAAFAAAIAAVAVDGSIELTPGESYRITDTVSMTSRHFHCDGKATIVADLNSLVKDALVLSSTEVRTGSAQGYKPAPRLEGIVVLVKSNLRDGIRLNGGDYPVWDRVDVQRDPVTAPTWRDGIHIEAAAAEGWTENLDFRAVRVHDAGRDGFRFAVPSNVWTNIFINVGNYLNCEVRGAGLCEPGVPVRMVSNNTDANQKISQHNFIGGEYQTNNTATNPNPDGFRHEKGGGCAAIENINHTGLTLECVPTSGTGYAINTTGVTRGTAFNVLPYNFTGSSVGIGGTGDYVTFGYLGLDKYIPPTAWTVSLGGGTVLGTPTVTYQIGTQTRVGKMTTANFEIEISNWNTSSGQIVINGLPSLAGANGGATGSLWSLNSVTLTAGYTQVAARLVPSSGGLVLYQLGSNVNRADVTVAMASTPFQIAGSVTYYTD